MERFSVEQPQPKKIVDLVAGTRPNFVKVAPLWHALCAADFVRPRLVHTGQHFDAEMSDAFFRDLRLPDPDHHLECGGGSHAQQTGRIMMAYEALLMSAPADWVIVVGDVNSTIACALAATKLGIPVAHLEAGLRSRDRSMPEEINRLATDAIANLLWTPSLDAVDNLCAEGIPADRIENVGNIMIDSYEMLRDRISAEPLAADALQGADFYGVVTLHRPVNVDQPESLIRLVEMLEAIASRIPLVLPLHPRTRGRLVEFGLFERVSAVPGLHITPPLGYIAFLALVSSAGVVITDSGGVQEETTYLGIPCLTMRDSTERPITVTQGTNRLVTITDVPDAIEKILAGQWGKGRVPDLWDGHTAQRVVESLRRHLADRI